MGPKENKRYNLQEMRNLLIIVLCLYLSGCSPYQEFFYGTYEASGRDFTYRLSLRSDSTFTLLERVQDGRPECSGQWRLIAKDTVLLKCSDVESLSNKLSNGYMSKREHRLLLNGRKIYYKNTALIIRK